MNLTSITLTNSNTINNPKNYTTMSHPLFNNKTILNTKNHITMITITLNSSNNNIMKNIPLKNIRMNIPINHLRMNKGFLRTNIDPLKIKVPKGRIDTINLPNRFLSL